MKHCASILICVLVLCACLSAQAQSKTEGSTQATSAVDAVDASVHPEVDGQPQEVILEGKRRQITNALSIEKRLPATAVWPAPTNIDVTSADYESRPTRAGVSSFSPEKVWGHVRVLQATRSVASGAAGGNVDPSCSNTLVRNAKPLTLRTTVPSEPDQTLADDPFGRPVLGSVGSSRAFPKRDELTHKHQTTPKRHQHQPRKPMTRP